MLRALCRASASELFRLGYEMGGSRSSANTATKPNAAGASGTALLIAAAYAAATKLSRMVDSLEREPRPIHRLCFYGTHPRLMLAGCQQLVLQYRLGFAVGLPAQY
jgi:hypothetical protein